MLRVTKWVTASFVRSSFLNAFCDKRRACRRMCQGSMFARIASNRIQNLQMIQRTNLSFLSLEEEKTKENGRNRTNVWFFIPLPLTSVFYTKRRRMALVLLLNQIANMQERITRIYWAITRERIFPVLILSYNHSRLKE